MVSAICCVSNGGGSAAAASRQSGTRWTMATAKKTPPEKQFRSDSSQWPLRPRLTSSGSARPSEASRNRPPAAISLASAVTREGAVLATREGAVLVTRWGAIACRSLSVSASTASLLCAAGSAPAICPCSGGCRAAAAPGCRMNAAMHNRKIDRVAMGAACA
jgi:hypothetical protein